MRKLNCQNFRGIGASIPVPSRFQFSTDGFRSVFFSRGVESPHFLHHSDNPRHSLISTLLNRENYFSCQCAMISTLSTKNKFCFVDATVSKPASSSSDHAMWIHCNYVVLSWLFNSLESDLKESVIYQDTIIEVWDDLKE